MKLNQLLPARFKSGAKKASKMEELGALASDGALSTFSGIFRVRALSESEQTDLRTLLDGFKNEEQWIEDDLEQLSSITAEIRAIHHQALLLHGERIKRAQELLIQYKEGAFTAWLIATYGNRQTPYNFLQYYELFSALPGALQSKLDTMPRQASYILASRNATLEEKQQIIEEYAGEPKHELIQRIRTRFPLDQRDGRAQKLSAVVLSVLLRLNKQLKQSKAKFTSREREELCEALESLQRLIEGT